MGKADATHFDLELTSGRITRSVWKLAWPMILLNWVNGLHSIVDHLLVGNFVPSEANEANAAIGVAWQLFLVMVVFIGSLLHGMNVLVAQYAGRQDRAMLSRIVYHTFLASLIILLPIIAPLGYWASPWLLNHFNTSDAVKAYALPYMRILFVGGAPLFLLLLLTGALQAAGNPRLPLALGVLATVLNVLLSALFIMVGKMGVAGAALGTCIGPCISVIIAMTFILEGKTILQMPERWEWKPDWALLLRVARIGIPTGLQAVAMNIGAALFLGIIGNLPNSAAAQAAYTLCYAQLFMMVVWASFGLRAAASTLMGQNIGAGKPERGVRCVHVACMLGTLWAVILGVTFWAIPGSLLAMFGARGEAIVEYGTLLLRYLGISGVAFALGMAFTGGLQGAGDTKSPMYIAVLTQIGVLLGICEAARMFHHLNVHVVWSAILLSQVTRYLLTHLVFRRGHWRKIQIAPPTNELLTGDSA